MQDKNIKRNRKKNNEKDQIKTEKNTKIII